MTGPPGRRRRGPGRAGPWLGGGLLVASIVAASFVGRWLHRRPLPRDPLRRLPADTDALLVVDLPALRASSVWRRLVVERGGAEGLERLRQRCGFDPLTGMEQLTAWVGGSPERPLDGLAVQFWGQLPVERLVGCLRTAVEADPAAGALRRVEFRGRPALQSGSGRSSAVALGDRLVLVGATRQVDAALGVLDGEQASARATFGKAWAELGSGAQLVFLARLRPRWIERLPEVPMDHSALRALRWLGLAVRLGPPVSMRLQARFASAEAARRTVRRLRAMRRRLGELPEALRGPMAQWLLGWRLAAEGPKLFAEGSWELDLLGRLLGRLLGEAGGTPSSVGRSDQHGGPLQLHFHGDGGGPDGRLAAPKPGARDGGSPHDPFEHQ